jgi:hypothetical protein
VADSPARKTARPLPTLCGVEPDMVSESEHAGAEVELVHLAVGADMEGDVDIIGLAASADDLQLGRERRFPGVGVDVEACTKPDRDWQPLPTFADLAR